MPSNSGEKMDNGNFIKGVKSMRHTLLLAVADDYSRRELSQTLGSKGIFVVESASPPQTVERINCFYPDVILLDLGTMKDNFDIVRRIKRVCNSPIIVAVPGIYEAAKVTGHEMGIEHCIAKPIETEALFMQIQCLAMRQS